MQLVEPAYQATEQVRDRERCGFIAQIRRAAVSIASSIAKDASRRTTPTFIHHVNVANGSLKEVETQLQLLVRLNLCNRDDVATVWTTCQSAGKRIARLTQSLDQKLNTLTLSTPRTNHHSPGTTS